MWSYMNHKARSWPVTFFPRTRPIAGVVVYKTNSHQESGGRLEIVRVFQLESILSHLLISGSG